MSAASAQLALENRAADPLSAYRAYLAAIARRDFAAVTQAMSEDYARPLHELRGDRDFAPLFELWCASQVQPVVIISSRFEDGCVFIDTRAGSERGSVMLRIENGQWRVAGER